MLSTASHRSPLNDALQDSTFSGRFPPAGKRSAVTASSLFASACLISSSLSVSCRSVDSFSFPNCSISRVMWAELFSVSPFPVLFVVYSGQFQQRDLFFFLHDCRFNGFDVGLFCSVICWTVCRSFCIRSIEDRLASISASSSPDLPLSP